MTSLLTDESAIRQFRAALVNWFRETGEDYPWRRTTDPYAILVSELMLQQTRIVTVLEKRYFERWMRRFPSVETLAEAEEPEVLKAWEGLGYYNRARNLQKTAKIVRDEYGGNFPGDLDGLLALPGVGRYTAGAVLGFAFDKRGVIVDGNVIRVLSRLLAEREPVDSSAASSRIWRAAETLTPETDVRAYNSAIMELGQKICVKSRPACLVCPVHRWCLARRLGIAEEVPVKRGRAAVTELVEHVGILVDRGRIFLTREDGSRRRGLWRLPEISEEEASDLAEAFRFKYSITRFRVTLVVHLLEGRRASMVGGRGSGRWFALDPREDLPVLGSPYRKALERYLVREGS